MVGERISLTSVRPERHEVAVEGYKGQAQIPLDKLGANGLALPLRFTALADADVLKAFVVCVRPGIDIAQVYQKRLFHQ